MNRKSYWSVSALIIATLIFSTLTFLTSCSSSSYSSSNPPPPTVTIAATSGSGQSAQVGQPFTNQLTATVTTGGTPTSGATVTFTAPASGASGTFGTPTPGATDTETTNSSGLATSQVFTANTTAGSYTVTASVSGAATPASFSLTNTPVVVVTSSNYSFYLSGQELNAAAGGPVFYALAGAVVIDSTGNVTGGEQDYNDAIGITSPQPSGDTITGGTLTAVDASTGLYTLTLITNNTLVGAAGTETFGVQFANTNHALIVQYDGTATSSGSLDLQTLPSTLSGGFAFAVSGVDSQYFATATAGVFTITGTAVAGVTDQNDSGTGIVTLNQAFTGTLSAADAFGRGTLSITGSSGLINYYVVGPEVVRIIGMDTTDASVGSGFGQGAGPFTSASLGASVFAMANNPFSVQNGEIGQFTTTSTSSNPANFAGVGEANEVGNGVAAGPASAISGTYTIASNGYGSLTIASGLGSAVSEGIYMTDPTLNLSDPNNPTGGGGGLILSLDLPLAGTTGVLIPQTDTSAASFTGNYAVGMQEFNNFSACALCEFDIAAQGSVIAGALSFTGDVSDPFLTLGAGGTGLYTGATFTSTPLADAANAGRYSMLSANTPANPLAATIGSASGTFDVVMYQASGGQLFWLEFDQFGVWVGPLAQQGSLTGLPASRKAAPRTQTKQKR